MDSRDPTVDRRPVQRATAALIAPAVLVVGAWFAPPQATATPVGTTAVVADTARSDHFVIESRTTDAAGRAPAVLAAPHGPAATPAATATGTATATATARTAPDPATEPIRADERPEPIVAPSDETGATKAAPGEATSAAPAASASPPSTPAARRLPPDMPPPSAWPHPPIRISIPRPEVPPPPATPPTAFPDETNTGVPPGTELTPSGSLTITEDGTIVDGLEITGTVMVKADNVIIRNTLIKNTGTIPVRVSDAENLLIEDTEIDGQGRGIPAVAYNNYTLRRVNIHSVGEGPRIAGGDVTIQDSYLHHMIQVDDNHTDVIQAVGGDNIVLRGNNLQSYNPDTGILGNAAFMFGEDDNPLRDCVVEGNLLNGGNYTVNGGGSGTEGAQCAFRDNRFERDFRYGARGNLGPNVTWDSSNRWLDSGEPVG